MHGATWVVLTISPSMHKNYVGSLEHTVHEARSSIAKTAQERYVNVFCSHGDKILLISELSEHASEHPLSSSCSLGPGLCLCCHCLALQGCKDACILRQLHQILVSFAMTLTAACRA